jgi:hypothetical protein
MYPLANPWAQPPSRRPQSSLVIGRPSTLTAPSEFQRLPIAPLSQIWKTPVLVDTSSLPLENF